jgi:hypothetical protein
MPKFLYSFERICIMKNEQIEQLKMDKEKLAMSIKELVDDFNLKYGIEVNIICYSDSCQPLGNNVVVKAKVEI